MPSSTASDQLLPRDLLLGVELEEGTDEVATHDASVRCCDCSGGADIKKRGGHPRHGAAVQLRRNYTPGMGGRLKRQGVRR